MKYYKVVDGNYTDKQGIDYEKALDILLGTWKDNDMTRDMLTIPNRIVCMFSEILVCDKDSDEIGLVAGLDTNQTPYDFGYDIDGNRKWVRVWQEEIKEDGRIVRHKEWEEIQ